MSRINSFIKLKKILSTFFISLEVNFFPMNCIDKNCIEKSTLRHYVHYAPILCCAWIKNDIFAVKTI